MVTIPSAIATELWTRFRNTGVFCPERWIHEAAEAEGVELSGHSVADRTPTLVRLGDEVHAINANQGRPFNVLIGHVVHDTFVARKV